MYDEIGIEKLISNMIKRKENKKNDDIIDSDTPVTYIYGLFTTGWEFSDLRTDDDFALYNLIDDHMRIINKFGVENVGDVFLPNDAMYKSVCFIMNYLKEGYIEESESRGEKPSDDGLAQFELSRDDFEKYYEDLYDGSGLVEMYHDLKKFQANSKTRLNIQKAGLVFSEIPIEEGDSAQDYKDQLGVLGMDIFIFKAGQTSLPPELLKYQKVGDIWKA